VAQGISNWVQSLQVTILHLAQAGSDQQSLSGGCSVTCAKGICVSRLGVSPAPWEQLAVIDTLGVFLREAKSKSSPFL